MKNNLRKILIITLCFFSYSSYSQICEWRLNNAIYTPTDPDGVGPAIGSVSFTLQLHTTAGSISGVTGISTGWSYQSAKAMIPTAPAGPGCPSTVSAPANVAISAYYAAGGFSYTTVNQCGNFSQNVGTQTYDKRAVGTLDAGGTGVTIDGTWRDVMTITMWTLSPTFPQGGNAIINSSSGGAPNVFNTYAVSDIGANEYIANSLTTATPLALGTNVAPVTFSKFDANCNDKGTALEWITSQEINSKNYEVEKSFDGANWKSIATIKAAGNSSTDQVYNYLDLISGAANYRIKQIDMDGRFTYTNIKSTNCTPKNIDIAIYPVPAKDKLNVAISANKNINTQFIIYDATGRMVKQLSEKIIVGNNALQIDLTNLPNGQYILRSTDQVLNINKKFTILK
jgi:hypothetical protein